MEEKNKHNHTAHCGYTTLIKMNHYLRAMCLVHLVIMFSIITTGDCPSLSTKIRRRGATHKASRKTEKKAWS